MNIRELIDSHPEVLQDRHGLSYSEADAVDDIARGLRQQGVIMLRRVLDKALLADCQRSFAAFAASLGQQGPAWGRLLDFDDAPKPEWAHGETPGGSWHNPWVIRHWWRRPAAGIISAVIASWAWPLVERMCGSTDVAILLGLCQARHAIDVDLGVGAHQDAKVLPAVAPFALWVPLQDLEPRQHSAIGFVVGDPQGLLPTLPHNDVGPDYVLDRIERVWVPSYRAGDLTAHTNTLPHFTTGYGTGSHRFSLEVRAVAAKDATNPLDNPSVLVSRVSGRPRIVATHYEPPVKAGWFLKAFRVERANLGRS
ncbi:MAG: hypothetical protein JO339_24655 [Alphaproteobacteria bacterium]|nr:hypothetical protein [Alphaproteobacteria bacterium]